MGKYTKWIYLEKPNTKYLNMPLTFLQIIQEIIQEGIMQENSG